MKIDFQIGDRILYTGPAWCGETGTIVVILDNEDIGVCFDSYNAKRHTLGYHCASGYGWWCQPKNISRLDASSDYDSDELNHALNELI